MEKKQSLLKACLIWGIAALFYLYEMILRVSPSVMIDDLILSFNTTSTMLGIVISFYYYAYTLLQLPSGIILDKIGPKNLVAISGIMCVFGSLIFATTKQMYVAQIGRFLVGAGSACAFISCLQIGSFLFPKKYFAIIAGITNMIGTLGGLLGEVPIARLVNSIGWKNTIYWLSALGVFITLAALIFIPRKLSQKNVINKLSIVQSIIKIVNNNRLILTGLVAGLMYLPISVFSELWAVPFFMTKYNINNELASLVSTVLFVGVAIGSIVLAFVAKQMNNYIKIIRYSSLFSAILFVILIYCDFSIATSLCLVLLIGILTGGQILNFTCASNYVEEELSGTALAFTNTIVMLIGSIVQPILGTLLDLFWNGKISIEGTRIYEISCYNKAISSLPICLLLAYALTLFIKDKINKKK